MAVRLKGRMRLARRLVHHRYRIWRSIAEDAVISVAEKLSFYSPAVIGVLMLASAILWLKMSKLGNYVWLLIRDPKTPIGLSNEFVSGLIGNLVSGAIELVLISLIVNAMIKRIDRKKWRGLRQAVLGDFTPHHSSILVAANNFALLCSGEGSCELADDRFDQSPAILFLGDKVRVSHIAHLCRLIIAHTGEIERLYLVQRHLFDSATIEKFGKYLLLIDAFRKRCDAMFQTVQFLGMAENFCHASFKTIEMIRETLKDLKSIQFPEIVSAYEAFYDEFSGRTWRKRKTPNMPKELFESWSSLDQDRIATSWYICVLDPRDLPSIGYESEYWSLKHDDKSKVTILRPIAAAEQRYQSPSRISEEAMRQLMAQENRHQSIYSVGVDSLRR